MGLSCACTIGCQPAPSTPSKPGSALVEGMEEGIPGIAGFTVLQVAMDSARKADRPLFIYFTGYQVGIGGGRQTNVLSSPEVASMINRSFVVLYQYVDDRQATSGTGLDTTTGSPRTRGAECSEFQRATFKIASQPYVGFMDPVSMETLGGFGYQTDTERIMITLENATHYFANKAH